MHGPIRSKKQQSAIELLATYSWAFLVVAIFAATVLVLSLAQPARNYLGSSCNILPELPCYQSLLYSGASGNVVESVTFTNNLGTPIMFTGDAFDASTIGVGALHVSGLGDCMPSFALQNDRVTCVANISGAQTPPIGTYLDTSFVISYEICNGEVASSCPAKTYKTSGMASQTFGLQKGSEFVINFGTSPSTGFIVVDGVSYASNTATQLQASTYTIYAAPPTGYTFNSWSVQPSNELSVTNLQTGALTIDANTVLTASFTLTSQLTTSTSTSTTVTTTTSTSTTTSTTTVSTISYVPITITNGQHSSTYVPITITNGNGATVGNFQQIINITPTLYSSNESAGLGNIRFYEGKTELHSWCESGCNSSSSKATFWILAPGGIQSGTTTLNMTFLSVGTTYDGDYAGEAPQLSPTYAEYDNGNTVFTAFYQRWGGLSSLPSGWSTGGSGSGTISYNAKNLTLTYTGGSNSAYHIDYALTETPSVIYDWYGNPYGSGLNGAAMSGFATADETGQADIAGVGSGNPNSGSTFYISEQLSATTGADYAVNTSVPIPNSNNVYTQSFISSSSDSGTLNYNGGKVTQNEGISSTGYLTVGVWQGSGGTQTLSIYWSRIRAYPPNGVMPTATAGSLVIPQSTASTFQQMVVLDSASYNDFAANLSNLEFTYGQPADVAGNVPLYAWIESNATASSTHTLLWIQLTNSIAAASNGVIYMNFMPSNSPIVNGYTGYAPQMYCSGCAQTSYGQYDNGNTVFLYYQRWGGLNALPSGWTNFNNGAQGTLTFNAASIKFTSTSTQYWEGIATSTTSAMTTQPVVIETYQNVSSAYNQHEFGIYNHTNALAGSSNYMGLEINNAGSSADLYSDGATT